MRDLIRQILKAYESPKLEGQNDEVIRFSGQEADGRRPVQITIPARLLGNDPQIAARFRRLAQTIRQLNHPNIVSVRTVGERSGMPYIVTRAIEKAQPLAAKLDQPWAVDAAADVVMQVGQALDHAYRKGIVHGTLSPESVVVRDDGRALVADLGVGEMLTLMGGAVKQGRAAIQAPSPYLAPERAAGRAPDARADVYSLGSILYSLLTKLPPQVVNRRIAPPSRFNPDVPRAMDDVIIKALAPKPANRYPDPKSFLAALGAVTLVPAVEKVHSTAAGQHCARCGAEAQKGRFCRKCGAALAPQEQTRPPAAERHVLDEPIQITKVEVSRFKVGKGIEVQQTVIAQPMPVATGELAAQFPDPLDMPQLDSESLWSSSDSPGMIAMPEPPPMPVVDWAEIAPPMPEVPTIEDVQIEQKRNDG